MKWTEATFDFGHFVGVCLSYPFSPFRHAAKVHVKNSRRWLALRKGDYWAITPRQRAEAQKIVTRWHRGKLRTGYRTRKRLNQL